MVVSQDWRFKTATQRRSVRIAVAKQKGRHTRQEWEALKEFYGFRCVQCGKRETKGYYGVDRVWLEKDHVFPIANGGCDCIGNIQPLCFRCNARKGTQYGDYRHEARMRWNLTHG